MGRPKKEAVSSAEVTIVLDEYPALSDIESERVREILLLSLIGHNQQSVAKRLGITQSAVSQTLSRYDPDSRYRPNADLRKEVIKSSLGSVALDALRHLLEKTDEMKEYTPKTLIDLISKIEDIQASLGGKKEAPSNTQKALSELSSAK